MFRSKKTTDEIDETPVPEAMPRRPKKKSAPTPKRKQAEAERRQRRNPVLSKSELRARKRRASSSERLRAIEARDAQPEKVLLRDHIDSRFNVGELLLPFMVIMLGFSILGATMPNLIVLSSAGLYSYLLLVIVDAIIMWRRFKKLLHERLPNSSPKGLLMYGLSRLIQIRRFRTPPPRIKRGEKY